MARISFAPMLALCLLLLVPGGAAQPVPTASRPVSVQQTVAQLSAALRLKPSHPRLLGLFSFAVRLAHPHAAAGFHLALFEARSNLDLSAVVGGAIDGSWQRILQTRMSSGEQCQVYARPRANRWQMLLLSLGADHQLALVAMDLSARKFERELDGKGSGI